MEFPSGMLGVALGTILLPSLAKSYADENLQTYSALLDWGLRLTLLLAIPSAVALAVLSVPLVTTLFYYGAFTANDVTQTCNAVTAYAIGLVGLIAVKVLAPGYYARQDIRTPVKMGLITLVFTQLLNLVLIGDLQHAGLALAISLGATLNALMLLRGLRQRGVYQPQPGWMSFSLKLLLAVMVMAAVLWALMGAPAAWFAASGLYRVLWLMLLVVAGSAVYFLTLFTLGFRLNDFSRRAS
jgi:putative peptidoglycan lipid II flippase